MKDFFSWDNPFMVFMGLLADIIILNLLFLLCCIPIVTIGASVTALHYVTIKIANGENYSVAKDFFKSFKQNFKQATIIWFILSLIAVVLILDYRMISYLQITGDLVLRMVILFVGLFLILTTVYVFPILSKYENKIFLTMKNALYMSMIYFPKTIVLLLIYIVPILCALYWDMLLSVYILAGAAGSAYFAGFLWKKILKLD